MIKIILKTKNTSINKISEYICAYCEIHPSYQQIAYDAND